MVAANTLQISDDASSRLLTKVMYTDQIRNFVSLSVPALVL